MSNPLTARPCADISPAPVQWLWEPLVARGKLTVLDGEPGTGKSLLAVDLAARLSRGGPLPDGRPLGKPHVTLLLTADDPADTVRPRVAAAGADLARVIVAGGPGAPPQLPECVPDLAALVYEHAADLIVIDTLPAFLPRACAPSDAAVRAALAPLSAMAAETGCAVLLVRPLGRGVGPNAVYRGGGSLGVLASARTGLLLARHPDDPELRVLSMTKSDLGPPAASLGFRLTAGATGPALQWAGPVDLSADELCVSRAAESVRRPRERAAEFLREALTAGPRPVAELEKLAADRGLNWKTLERAKRAIGVVSEQGRKGDGHGWSWRLPSLHADGDALRSATLNALLKLPKQIRVLHELQDEAEEVESVRLMREGGTDDAPPG